MDQVTKQLDQNHSEILPQVKIIPEVYLIVKELADGLRHLGDFQPAIIKLERKNAELESLIEAEKFSSETLIATHKASASILLETEKLETQKLRDKVKKLKTKTETYEKTIRKMSIEIKNNRLKETRDLQDAEESSEIDDEMENEDTDTAMLPAECGTP